MTISERQEQIIKVFVDKQQVLTAKDISLLIGVSSRTVRTDIKQLNEVLINNGAIILSENSKGYKINIKDKEKFEAFLKKIEHKSNIQESSSENRVLFIINKLILNELEKNKPITQSELSDELFISVSQLKNDFKIVKYTLEKSNILVGKASNKGLRLNYEECDLRKFIEKKMLSDEYKFKKQFSDIFFDIYSCKESFIENEIKEILKNNSIKLSDSSFKGLYYKILIMMIRMFNEKSIGNQNIDVNIKREEKAFNLISMIFENIEKKYSVEIDFLEKKWIFKYFTSLNTSVNDGTSNYMQEVILEIFEEINKYFDIDFSKDLILNKFLSSHIKAAINRAIYEIEIDNSMLSFIKHKFPFAFEVAITANRAIVKKMNVCLCENDIGFLAMHFEAALERLKTKTELQMKKVVLVCGTGMGTSLFLKARLLATFKNKIEILDTISVYEFNDSYIECADIIISTINLELKSDKTIYIKNLLDSNEISRIESFLNDKTDKNNFLVNLFPQELFTKDEMSGENNIQIIEQITKLALNKGYITQSVKNKIFEREYLASTEIGGLVAIPHTMSSEIKKSFIQTTILKKSVIWKNENVQLIFLIGIANDDKKYFKENIEKLYSGILNFNNVIDIIKSNSFEEFLDIIKKF